jgi:hypothetical protein
MTRSSPTVALAFGSSLALAETPSRTQIKKCVLDGVLEGVQHV